MGCSQSDNPQPGELEFAASLEKVVELKSDEDVEDSWILRPTELAVDDQDRVYVLDQKRKFIQQFDPEGNFIRAIGTEGRGPGEFDDLYAIFADSIILGYDRSAKTMSKFSIDGDFQTSYTIQGIYGDTKIYRVRDQYLLFHMNFSNNLDDFHGLRVYDQNFEMVGEPQLHASEIYPDFNEEISYQVSSTYVNIHFVDEGRFLVAPTTYSGQIFEYTYNSRNNIWEQARTINGVEIEEAYERLPNRENADMLFFSAGSSEAMAFKIHGQSQFISQLSDGRFVHFVRRDVGKTRQYGVELYTENLDYLGYSVLKTDPDYMDDEYVGLPYPRAKDTRDLFYGRNFGEKVTIEGYELIIQEGEKDEN